MSASQSMQIIVCNGEKEKQAPRGSVTAQLWCLSLVTARLSTLNGAEKSGLKPLTREGGAWAGGAWTAVEEPASGGQQPLPISLDFRRSTGSNTRQLIRGCSAKRQAPEPPFMEADPANTTV
jgi:hypothetical protein